jgi:imidazolonepropionase-like amidohydrolase
MPVETTMRKAFRVPGCAAMAAAVAAAIVAGPAAEAPHIYAVTGARIVTAAGEPIAKGTIVIRNGVIDAVGADVRPPASATVIDGAGLTVYPGLIDMGNSTAVESPAAGPRPTFRSIEEAERHKRTRIFRPDFAAADHLRADSSGLSRLASAGITSVLATPAGSVVKGRSALVNVTGPDDEPQIGDVGDYRRGLQVVRTPVALHVEFPSAIPGDGYPVSLMGGIAFLRQSFLDAQHRRLVAERYERVKTADGRPSYDPALEALLPALAGRLPVAFAADESREILRALDMAAEFGLTPIITGAREADRVAADLATRQASVIYSLDFPTRSRSLAPGAEEPLRVLRTRANAPRVPAALAKAGVPFAFASAGLREPGDFVRNAARAVREGLGREAAIRALTIDAARMAGAGERLGTLQTGRIANVIVTDGDLFDDKTRIRHVFVDGRSVPLEERQPDERGEGGRGGT